MSTEVEQGMYLYKGAVNNKNRARSHNEPSLADILRRKQLELHESTPEPNPRDSPSPVTIPHLPIPFRHNPLHDMESIFWLSVWLPLRLKLVENDPDISSKAWNQFMAAQGTLGDQLFRDQAFRGSVMANCLVDHVADILPQVSTIVCILDDFRQALVDRFREVEKRIREPGYKIGFDAADGLHSSLHQDLVEIATLLDKKNLFVDIGAKRNLVGKKSLRAGATTASHATTRLSCHDGDEPPSKSLKTAHGASAGATSAPLPI